MRRIKGLAGCLVVVPLVVACGSDDSFTVGGSSDAGSPGDKADATVVADAAPLSPDASAPDAGLGLVLPDAGRSDGGCVEGQVVETGNDIRWECDAIQVCQGGTLVSSSSANAQPGCPTPLASETAGCPGSAAAAVDAGPCNAGLGCDYGDDFCRCETLGDGGTQFLCPRPADGCPTTRPRLGSPCSEDGGPEAPWCSYLDCGFTSGPDTEGCIGGTWQEVSVLDICGR